MSTQPTKESFLGKGMLARGGRRPVFLADLVALGDLNKEKLYGCATLISETPCFGEPIHLSRFFARSEFF